MADSPFFDAPLDRERHLEMLDAHAHLHWSVRERANQDRVSRASSADRYLADPVNVANVRTVLKGAADSIETHGWCQGRLADFEGRVCLAGAMLDAADVARVNLMNTVPAIVLVERVINRRHRGGIMYSTLVASAWNDSGGRTVEEVQAVIREALDLLDTY